MKGYEYLSFSTGKEKLEIEGSGERITQELEQRGGSSCTMYWVIAGKKKFCCPYFSGYRRGLCA